MKWIFVLLSMLSAIQMNAQDYLIVPAFNPSQFEKELEGIYSLNKLLIQEDSVIYLYDTLSLPFIDDFSANRLRSKVKDVQGNPNVTDTTLYAITLNGQIYRDTIGFVTDTTWTYQIGSGGDTVSQTVNLEGFIQFRYIYTFPSIIEIVEYYAPYNIFDTISKGVDTVFIESDLFQDSVTYYLVEKDTNSHYINADVYVNRTFGFYPPSIGVATFDGLDEDGIPYNINDITARGQADYLTSKPIDLTNGDDSIYFSFYYQAQGFSIDGPDTGDSLCLDFYNSTTGDWINVWGVDGRRLNDPPGVDSFKQEILFVPSSYKTNAFQFRFRNYAKLIGAYDQWNVDYIYLNNGRRVIDTVTKDLTHVYNASPLLKDFYAMPVWHFKTDPSQYMTDSVELLVRSIYDDPLNVFNKIVIPDTTNPLVPYYVFPGLNQFRPLNAFSSIEFNYPINFSYPPAAIDSFQIFKAPCDVDFRPASIETKDFIRANDTVYSKAVLNNYYAYDDGTAEAGYGTQGNASSFFAVEYNIPFSDTIGGVDLYFFPQPNGQAGESSRGYDIRDQKFQIIIYNSLGSNNQVYVKEELFKPYFSPPNGFVTYYFDSLVVVGQNFYVGIKTIGSRSLNVGYDLNSNNKNKLFRSSDGDDWFPASVGIPEGSPMVRPIFRKRNFGVGIKEHSQPNGRAFSIYPQPATNYLHLDSENDNYKSIRIYSIQGSLLYNESFKNTISLTNFKDGLYIIELENNEGLLSRKKFLISK